jgi:hypothetical protein
MKLECLNLFGGKTLLEVSYRKSSTGTDFQIYVGAFKSVGKFPVISQCVG